MSRVEAKLSKPIPVSLRAPTNPAQTRGFLAVASYDYDRADWLGPPIRSTITVVLRRSVVVFGFTRADTEAVTIVDHRGRRYDANLSRPWGPPPGGAATSQASKATCDVGSLGCHSAYPSFLTSPRSTSLQSPPPEACSYK